MTITVLQGVRLKHAGDRNGEKSEQRVEVRRWCFRRMHTFQFIIVLSTCYGRLN